MVQRGSFLLISRDAALIFRLSKRVQRYGVTKCTASYRHAAALSSTTQWSGIIADVHGMEAEPGEELQRLREAQPYVPALALASSADAQLVNALFALRAELVLTPIAEVNLVRFIQRAVGRRWFPDERVAAWIDELARRRCLTPREVQLLACTLGGETRREIQRWLGVSENTLKTQVRSLLKKCDAPSLDALAKRVLLDSLIFEGDPSAPEDHWRRHRDLSTKARRYA